MEALDHVTENPDEMLVESWTVVDRTLASFGVDYKSYARPENTPTDKELLEQALYERMVGRGLT